MSAYVPIPYEQTREIRERLAQVLKPQPIADPRLRKLARDFVQYRIDCQGVSSVFFNGLGVLRRDPASLRAEPSLQEWVKDKGVESRANRIVAHLVALGLCARLDDVLPKIVGQGRRQSPAILARCRLVGDKRLDAATKPTGKRGLDWPRDLLGVFSIKWDDLIVAALKDLVAARDCAAHELPQAEPDYWRDRMQVWGESATWLVQSLALSLESLLARGR